MKRLDGYDWSVVTAIVLLLTALAAAVVMLATCGCRCVIVTGDNSRAAIEGGSSVQPATEIRADGNTLPVGGP